MCRPILPLVLLLALSASAFSLPEGHAQIALPAVRGILECRFDDALRLTDSAYLASAGEPSSGAAAVAAVLHLAALGARDIDFDATVDSAAFRRSFERAKSAVDGYEAVHGATSYALTLRGFTLGMNASFRLKNGAYVAAAGTGLDAVKAMRRARELDSSNTEVDFFLGLYDYAKAELKKRLGAAMFRYPGGKADGIAQLERGAAGAALTGTACALALSDIYIAEGQSQKSRDIIFALKKTLANSRFLLWAEVKYFEDRKMFSQTAAIYGRLAESYDREAHGAYNAMAVRLRQARAHESAGEKAAAAAACGLILERRGHGGKRASGIVKDTEKLLKRLGR